MQDNLIFGADASSYRASEPLPSWQRQLSQAIRNPAELCRRLELPDTWEVGASAGHALFETCVPEAFLRRMSPNQPDDPLLRQVLPLGDETLQTPGYINDPLDEAHQRPARGVIHKYAGRALLIASPNCAVNCRYCFRRHFPYADNSPSRAQWQEAFDYLQADASIREVILSGGDPLAANDRHLAWLVTQLEQIPHLKRLRIHSRLPIVIPDRVDQPLLDWLEATRLQTVMVLHVNHANEIDQTVHQACQRLQGAGVTLLNQSVLLRGVNDSTQALAALSERLFDAGVLPYYLHVLDPVQGAAHFNVPDAEARQLIIALRDELPGFLMPRLVREIPGEASKTPLV